MAITRLFHNHDDALAAVADLTNAGFKPAHIHVVTAAQSGRLVATQTRLGIGEETAKKYADVIEAGGALVVLDAPFGTAIQARQVLESAHPAGASSAYHGDEWNDDLPVSSALGLPTLWPKGSVVSSTAYLVGRLSKQSPSSLSGVAKASARKPTSANSHKVSILPFPTLVKNSTPRSLAGVRKRSA